MRKVFQKIRTAAFLTILMIPLLSIAVMFNSQSKPMDDTLKPIADVPSVTQPSPIIDDERPSVSIPSLIGTDIKNASTALKYGINGYIEASISFGTPSTLLIRPGNEVNVTVLLHFVSHLADYDQTWINLDPTDENGLVVEQGLGDGKGTVKLNDLLKYEPSGRILIKAGETLAIRIKIAIPKEFPGVTIPLHLVGVTSEVPILDNLEVKLSV